ncbi:MAG: TetR family transcriptional regulator [Synergistaceae bacterium]|nr:TetR family transcriptional regulator [Synergistaceae bacterium]
MSRKTKEDSIKTRELLLEAALDVFSEKSFSDVTLNEIAERVGMTKGAFYWHFKNKSDILFNLIEEIHLSFEREFEEKFGEPKTLADLNDYYKKKLVPPDRNDRFMKINAMMLRRFEWPDEVRSNLLLLLKDQITREKRMVNDILRRSQEEGVIRKDIETEDVSAAITTVFYGLFILVFSKTVAEDLTSCADFISDAFRKELLYKAD